MKKKLFFISLFIFVSLGILLVNISNKSVTLKKIEEKKQIETTKEPFIEEKINIKKTESNNKNEYGVFIGLNENETNKLEKYKIVVIEPSEFSIKKIKELKSKGKIIYGYLNVGSVEEYRPYYDRFKNLFLGVYEDWPDERWIDVSSLKWQDFIINELGKRYKDMEFDGLF